MKTRRGFVSNSSSSSFIIGSKKELCSGELMKAFKERLGDKPLSALLAEALALHVQDRAERVTEWCESRWGQVPPKALEVLDKFDYVYLLTAETDGGDSSLLSRALHHHATEFSLETPRLVIRHLYES